LMNPGLQAREFRIIGGGRIVETGKKPDFFSKKTKQGIIKQKTEANQYLVSGLFSTSDASSKFVGKQVVTPLGVSGEIVAFLSSGEVLIKIKERVYEGERVYFYIYKKLKS
jgi:hypothetical protein